MIHEFVKNSSVKLKDVSEYLGLKPPCLHRVLVGNHYMGNDQYDKLYNYLEEHGNVAPRRNGVVLYPSGKAHGSFDIFIDNNFVATLVFRNVYDIINFLNEEDDRLQILRNFIVTGTSFVNKIISKGHSKKD